MRLKRRRRLFMILVKWILRRWRLVVLIVILGLLLRFKMVVMLFVLTVLFLILGVELEVRIKMMLLERLLN